MLELSIFILDAPWEQKKKKKCFISMGFDIQLLIATRWFNKIVEISMPKLAKKNKNQTFDL